MAQAAQQMAQAMKQQAAGRPAGPAGQGQQQATAGQAADGAGQGGRCSSSSGDAGDEGGCAAGRGRPAGRRASGRPSGAGAEQRRTEQCRPAGERSGQLAGPGNPATINNGKFNGPNQGHGGGKGAGDRDVKEQAPYAVKQEISQSQDIEGGKILASSMIKAKSEKGQSNVGNEARRSAARAGRDGRSRAGAHQPAGAGSGEGIFFGVAEGCGRRGGAGTGQSTWPVDILDFTIFGFGRQAIARALLLQSKIHNPKI